MVARPATTRQTPPRPIALRLLTRVAKDGRERSALATRYIASVVGVAAVTWLISLLVPHYHVGNISMVYLLLVLALAVFAGSGPAILASVLSVIAFDWYFVPPVGQVVTSSPDEWLALFLFLVVAIITGQLAAGLRQRAEESRRRERETAALYELSVAILGDAQLEHVLQVIAARLVTTLELSNGAVFLANADGRLEPAAEAGTALEQREADARLSAVTAVFAGRQPPPSVSQPDAAGDEYIPVLLGGQRLGVLVAGGRRAEERPRAERERLLLAFAAQTALAVGRAKLAQEEERARAAAASEQMKSIFLATVSHDLRTPLTSIKAAAVGPCPLLQGDAEGVQCELAASIDREADRLNHLVGNLLEMSRIESGGLALRTAPEDVAEIAGTAVHRVTPLLGGRRLAVRAPDDLPLVALDAAHFDRVVTNLLENAIKFSPGESTIRLDVWSAKARVFLRARNDGSPLSAAERLRIFDKFFRLRPADGAGQGTGLGLAICKGIVEAHGGEICAEEAVDGVSFLVSLPCLEAGRTAAPLPAGAHA